MLLQALCLALLAGGPSDHGTLHPADADLYVSIPDVGAALHAYADMPLLRILREPEIRQPLVGAGVDVERMLSELVPGVDLAEFLGKVRGVSLSLSLGDGAPEELSARIVADFEDAATAGATYDWLRKRASNATDEGDVTRFGQGSGGPPGWFRVTDTRLTMGLGASSSAAPVPSEASFASTGPHRFGEASGTVLLDVFTRRPLSELVGDLAQAMGRSPLPSSPIELLGAAGHARLVLDRGRFVVDVVEPAAADDPPIGFQSLDAKWLETVPAGIFGAYSTTVNGAGLADLLLGFLRTQPGAEQGLADLEELFGFPLDQPFRQLGPGFAAYMFPLRGIGLPASYAWIEVRDAEAFRADLDAFLAKLPDILHGASVSTRDYRPRDARTGERVRIPITTVKLPKEVLDLGPMISFAPTIALLEDRLLLGVSSMSVKRELKRVFGAPDAPGLAATEGFEVPEGTRTIGYVDFGALIDGVFGLVKSLSGLMGSMGGGEVPFDPSSLPDPDVITQHLRPTVYTSRVGEEGRVRHLVSSFGPELLVLPALIVPRVVAAMRTPPEPVLIEEAPPAAADSTASRLGELRTALAVYQVSTGSYPESLSDLRRPTDDFPDGFLTGEVPLDGWGQAFVYRRSEDGTSYELRSLGPNGTDENGEGDDVVLD